VSHSSSAAAPAPVPTSDEAVTSCANDVPTSSSNSHGIIQDC